MNEDLTAVLRTIREVGDTLEARERKASAVVMITWGLMAGAIFALYQWATMDTARFVGAIGEVGLTWLWVPFVLVGYVLTLAVRVRLGRIDAREGSQGVLRLMLTLLVPLALVVVAMVSGVGQPLIPALMTAYLGYTFLMWPERAGGTREGRIIGSVALALALALALPWMWPWANGVTSGCYLVLLFGRGLARYYA